jgi:hypothetical protein
VEVQRGELTPALFSFSLLLFSGGESVKSNRELVKEIVLRYVEKKPRRITLTLKLNEERSVIIIESELGEEIIEIDRIIDFTNFAHGVIDAFEEVYGELKVIPISLREDVYENDRLTLTLYPTGSIGVFDIYVEYH